MRTFERTPFVASIPRAGPVEPSVTAPQGGRTRWRRPREVFSGAGWCHTGRPVNRRGEEDGLISLEGEPPGPTVPGTDRGPYGEKGEDLRSCSVAEIRLALCNLADKSNLEGDGGRGLDRRTRGRGVGRIWRLFEVAAGRSSSAPQAFCSTILAALHDGGRDEVRGRPHMARARTRQRCRRLCASDRRALRLGRGSTGGEGLAGGQTQAREQPSSYHAPSSWFPVSRSRTVRPTRQSHRRIGTKPARNGSWRAGLAAACPPNGYSRAGRRLAR
ncbi:hypothetical protein C8Q76DRAFT_450627 [Earliella scabrosa]|nr:hypothetical protein C8Q76DRAFT_450627 [Earliella scabrosa]